jgi:Cu+-exporting ATPase
VLATPTAISAGIGNAAKNGVLIKSGDVLEEFSKITTVFFDKTGTLTQGKVSVVEFEVAETKSKAEILAKVVAVEKHSAHPFACAIVDFGMSQGIEVLEATSVESVVGSGMKGFVGGVQIEIRKADLKDNNVASSVSEILENGDVVAKVYFSDKIRSQSKDAVARIKNLGCNVAMLSGDNYSVAKNVGQECGI